VTLTLLHRVNCEMSEALRKQAVDIRELNREGVLVEVSTEGSVGSLYVGCT